MARKNKVLPLLNEVEISDLAAEGKAVARVDDLVVFVPYAVPNDVVDLQITKKKHNYREARVVAFHKYSDKRQEPVCQHFGVCGGCKWQILKYEEQMRYKQKEVENNLRRIGKIELPDIQAILPSKKTEFYRNKLEFTFSNRRWRTFEEMQDFKSQETRIDNQEARNENGARSCLLSLVSKNLNAVGFHIPNQFDKVLDIEKCWLQDDISNQIRNEIRRYALENNLTFFDLKNHEGFLRTMIIRTSTTGEIMLVVVFFYEDKNAQNALLQHLAETFPQITALLYVINSKANDTITDQKICVFKGRDHIFEMMENLRFKIGAKSFYQTNSEQAYELYKVARNFAQLSGNELVYDLYTGTGTIANFIARNCKKVIGIEYVPEAIEDAKVNSEINGIDNTLFFAGDMKDILTQNFIAQHGKPDVIITDPPRAGMHEDVMKAILFAAPQRIVYVSCNSATQARDLNLLCVDYQVIAVQPVDMFPHTHHVENVVLLDKRQKE